MTNPIELNKLLTEYFDVMGGGLGVNELARRLRNIDKPDDLTAIDRDMRDPLWSVVPQILMHRFGVDAFKAFRPSQESNQSFIFVHPAHSHIVPRLHEALSKRWTVGKPLKRELCPELICGLYGGYAWYAAYAAACQHRSDFGQLATILPLAHCNHVALQDLIAYKNVNRTHFSERIVIPRDRLSQTMDGVIQAFHCPDVIENTRQMLHLGLVNSDDI